MVIMARSLIIFATKNPGPFEGWAIGTKPLLGGLIYRKVAIPAKFDLAGISRGCLNQPQKVLLWTLQKSPRLQSV